MTSAANAAPTGFISDGYTRTATVPALAGFHPAVTLTFRPMLKREMDVLGNRIGTAAPYRTDALGTIHERPTEKQIEAAQKIFCDSMAAKIVEWSIVDCDGSPVVVSGENFDRLEPHLAASIAGLVRGETAPVEDAAGN